MAIEVKHLTQAAGTDAGNGEIRKAQWNESHTLNMASASLLGRSTAGAGAAEEISIGSGLSLSAGALAVSKAFPAGDIVGTTDTQSLSNKTFTDNPTFSTGTATGVLYLNGSNVLSSNATLTFDGTALQTSGSAGVPLQVYKYAASGSVIIGQYTASGTSSAPTAVVNGRAIGRNNFFGYDGTSFFNAAAISVFVDGAVSTGSVPGKIVFTTNSVGGVAVAERMAISASGNVSIAGLTASKPVFTDASKNLTSAGTLGVDQGGTGATTAAAGFNALSPITAAGDLIIGNGVNSATRLAIGANTQVLTSNGTTASWQTPSTGVTLADNNTWTGIQTFTNSNARLLGSSTGYTTFTSANSSALNYTLTIPAVTGTVAVLGAAQSFTATQTFAASGVRLLGSSTGYTTFTSANASATNYTLTFPAITDTLVTVTSAGTLTNKTISGLANTISNVSLAAAVTGTLPVANGGTGAATLTGIVKGNGTGAFSAATAGTDYVTPTGAETLTNKTLTAPTITGAILNNGYTEAVFAVTGTAPALSPANGSIQTWTLTANSTPTSGTWNAGQSITLMLNDSASAFTVTWTSLPVTWVGGSAPSLAPSGGFTVITLWEVGTTIYGALVGQVT